MYHPFPPHRYDVIPGLVTIRSSFQWTLPKLLLAAALIVIGFLILKRFGTPIQNQAPPRQRVNRYAHNRDYTQSQTERHWRGWQSAPPPRYARSSQPERDAGSASRFIPTWRRRKRLTKKQKARLLSKYNGHCAICHQVLQSFDTEFDHIETLASDPFGLRQRSLNAEDNHRPLCRRCHGWVTMKQRKAGLFKRPATTR